jgi:tetratricopeptide (TPR) repeat protein
MVGGQRMQSEQQDLERQYDEHLNQATAASVQNRDADATRHSAAALAIVRELYRATADAVRHRPVLAAALYNQAGHLRRAGQVDDAAALLTESAEHYHALAAADPAAYQVRLIDVLVRAALVAETAGDLAGAEARLRQAIRMYPDAPAHDLLERELGLARAQFHLGRCLLRQGRAPDALAEVDAGLFAAEAAREQRGIAATDFSWLAAAPPSFQYIGPDWVAGAVCAMELHGAAGRWGIAADAANIAVRVSGGMAAMGGAESRRVYETVLSRAQPIWQRAQDPLAAAMAQVGPGQEVIIGGSQLLFGTPDLQELFRITGWDPGGQGR